MVEPAIILLTLTSFHEKAELVTQEIMTSRLLTINLARAKSGVLMVLNITNMPHNVDKESVEKAYQNVRCDNTKEIWALFGYSDNDQIVHFRSGTDYHAFLGGFNDEERLYGFVRIETGDEMSKRVKFVFITWIGENVSPLKKARVSTDKGNIKHYITNFAAEILTSDSSDLKYETIRDQVDRYSGAHYGTGK